MSIAAQVGTGFDFFEMDFSSDPKSECKLQRITPHVTLCLIAMVSCLIFIASLGSQGWAAELDGANIAANGTAAGAPACASCHGENGEGQPAGPFPRLAGVDAGYLVEQLKGFADGSRKNGIMGPIATALKTDEMQAVADFYAGETVNKADELEALDPSAIAAGEMLATKGDWSKDLPECAQCHGPGGVGVGSTFPRLSGQSMEYLVAQLQAWQQGIRTNDPLHLMTNVASKLNAEDVKAVASYYASLPVVPDAGAKGTKK